MHLRLWTSGREASSLLSDPVVNGFLRPELELLLLLLLLLLLSLF